jgi:tetratricopeptide (TPR) repeat protein
MCLRDLVETEFAARNCSEVVALARRMIAIDPASANWSRYLAHGLFGAGESIESVRSAFEQSWRLRSPARRPAYEASDRAGLAIAIGDFDGAERYLRSFESVIAESNDETDQFEWGDRLVNLYLEQGRNQDALRVADAYAAKRAAWTPSPFIDASIYVQGWRYRAGVLPADAFHRFRDDWLAQTKSQSAAGGSNGVTKGSVWVAAFASPAITAADGREAMARLPEYLPLPAAFARTDEDEAIGRAYTLAGDVETARSYLRDASESCGSLAFPFDAPRAAYELARTLEHRGAVPEACESYRKVVRRWPSAVSRTAQAASESLKRLACP